MPGILSHLRAATEDDVTRALDGACISLPIPTKVEALELFQRMLDVLTGEDERAQREDLAASKGQAGWVDDITDIA